MMIDGLGYAASTAVLATFLMRNMVPLRIVAIASNLLFVLYGYFAHVPPVLLLHIALLPINVVRLAALRRGEACQYKLARHNSPIRALRAHENIFEINNFEQGPP